MTEFITRNYGNKEFEVIIKTDSKEHYKQTEDFARKLIDHAKQVKKMTNAQKIRAMSDEELLKWFGDNCPPNSKCDFPVDCDACWRKWLKQPAEVDNG